MLGRVRNLFLTTHPGLAGCTVSMSILYYRSQKFPRFRRKVEGLGLMKLCRINPSNTHTNPTSGREGTQGHTDGGPNLNA